jgi:hypothetical protein
MAHGLARLREGLPLSLRLLREVHQKLLSGGRGATQNPGEFRNSQNWIGGTRPGNAIFVPPPPQAGHVGWGTCPFLCPCVAKAAHSRFLTFTCD